MGGVQNAGYPKVAAHPWGTQNLRYLLRQSQYVTSLVSCSEFPQHGVVARQASHMSRDPCQCYKFWHGLVVPQSPALRLHTSLLLRSLQEGCVLSELGCDVIVMGPGGPQSATTRNYINQRPLLIVRNFAPEKLTSLVFRHGVI
jgi:hypothetical protein